MLKALRALPRRFRAALLIALPAAAATVTGTLLLSLPVRAAALAAAAVVLTPLLTLVLLPAAHRLVGWLPRARPRWPPRAVSVAAAAEAGAAAGEGGPGRRAGASRSGRGRGTLELFLEQHVSRADDTELRIGIVLAGGGARGVYQAGALAALRDFLEREGALSHVRAVAATSIGTWNAMFWLTGRVGGGDLRRWWASGAATDIVAPGPYLPYLRNYFLLNRPWRRQFDELFGRRADAVAAGGPPWLYFTRTNVDRATLEAKTNRGPDAVYWRRETGGGGYEPAGRIVDPAAGRFALEDGRDLRSAVFTSLDMPPIFPRIREGGHAFEDGGVVDNLPIRYTTRLEGCNLLFVLPLHASFEAGHSDRSVARRLARVMRVRQGALERAALRDISLYNRLIEAGAPEPGFRGAAGRLGEIHLKPVTTFCLAPGRSLGIGTFDFWELPGGGAAAFDHMARATRRELARFEFSPENRDVRMRVVPADPAGAVRERDFTLR